MCLYMVDAYIKHSRIARTIYLFVNAGEKNTLRVCTYILLYSSGRAWDVVLIVMYDPFFLDPNATVVSNAHSLRSLLIAASWSAIQSNLPKSTACGTFSVNFFH